MAYIKVVERGQSDKYKDDDTYQDLIHYCCDPSKATYIGLVNLRSVETAPMEMEAVARRFKKHMGKRSATLFLHSVMKNRRGYRLLHTLHELVRNTMEIGIKCCTAFMRRREYIFT